MAAARSGEPKSTSRKFVTLGPTDQPAAVSASARRPRSVSTRARLVARIAGSSSASVTIVTETVDTDPGGRYGFMRAMTSGLAIGEPDAEAGKRVGLAGGAHDDEPRVGLAQREEGRPDELRVRLVEDDDRRLGFVRFGVGGEGRQEQFDRAVGLGEAGRVVRAAQPDDAAPARSRADRVDVERPALGGRSPRDGDDLGAALFGEHAVHRIGRRRQHGPGTFGEERLGDQVEDFVRAGAHEQLVGADAVAGGCRFGEPAVIRGRVLRERRIELARRQQAIDEGRRGGGGVEVEADDRVDRHAVALGDLLVRCLPRVGGRAGLGR